MTYKREIIDMGNVVVCDGCGVDYSASDAKGGLLFGSSGYCPGCAPRMEAGATEYGETEYIRDRARDGETFRDFIVRVRAGNNLVIIEGWDAER